MTMKHTPEPWGFTSDHDIRTKHTEANGYTSVPIADLPDSLYLQERKHERGPNSERIVECVNALAGVEDPERVVQAARALISAWGVMPWTRCTSAPDSGAAIRKEIFDEFKGGMSELGMALGMVKP